MNINLRYAMRIHAICSVIIGIMCLIMPHATLGSSYFQYNHLAHEYLRLYGCFSISVGWLVERCKGITDGNLMRIISEMFAVCYSLQFVVLLRAQITNPSGHSFLHIAGVFAFGVIAVVYGYVRLFRKAKEFELPQVQMRDD